MMKKTAAALSFGVEEVSLRAPDVDHRGGGGALGYEHT